MSKIFNFFFIRKLLNVESCVIKVFIANQLTVEISLSEIIFAWFEAGESVIGLN